jgi:subtilisin-like proprotein convertase family protein
VARLRPVEGRSERFETAVNGADVELPTRGTGETAVVLTAPSPATARSFEVSFQFRHRLPEELTFTLISPDGQSTVLRDRVAGGSSSIVQRVVGTFAAVPRVAGTWTLRASDTVDNDAGTIEDFALTIHYGGVGQPPIPALAVYQSPVRDLGAVTAIDRVTWDERRLGASDVLIKMRTGATEAECAAAPWSAAMTEPAGSTPQVAVHRFAQYRIEMISNGDTSASVEWIQVDYRAAP